MHEYTKYFKSEPGFERFIRELYRKYELTGKITGTIKLNKITKIESITLSRFLGEALPENEDVKISVRKITKIMENSRYPDFEWTTLISEYLGINISTKRERKELQNQKETKFFQTIIKSNDGRGNKWLQDVIENKQNPYIILHKQYQKDPQKLEIELHNILELVNNLPKDNVLLSIFASTFTKDPHYLDLDNHHSNLFFYALTYFNKSTYPNTREEKIKLLAKFHINIDNLSNFVLTYDLQSDKNYINEFTKEGQTLILNIQNILNSTYFDSSKKKVFIFENPSILTEIIVQSIPCSVVIAGGFPNNSVYLLLDKLVETGNTLFYNGDFDPEGIWIANKLKEKYDDHLVLFCYSKEDYEKCISKEAISEKRLKKLENITTKELQNMKTLLLHNKKSAYQENNKERLISFIKNQQ